MSRLLRRTPTYNSITTFKARPGICSACHSSFIATRTPTQEWNFTNPTHHVSSRRTFIATPVRQDRVALFRQVVDTRFKQIAPSKLPWREISKEMNSFGIKSSEQLKKEEQNFTRELKAAFELAETGQLGSRESLFNSLRLAFVRGDIKGLSSQLHFLFRNFLLRNRFSKPVTDVQRQLADFRYPWEWFPATRALQRTVHLHVGPTNSGKTYHALQALEKAKSGVYCGPLRLLAHEIYSRLNAKGKPCALLTGEEQRYPEDTDNYYISCTVEMAPMSEIMDVAVIDEIQMIADPDRGSAWTAALLGVQARELHLCGEERTVDLIQSICASIGDTCIVHRYERLTPLKAANYSIGKSFKNLQKGDCVVAFSRLSIHALKAGIERRTGRRCAVIYGSLPPETRAQQAALFNDPDNDYDFLVASDAIGMGLNLEVKRVVFESVTKHDGYDWRSLTISEIRQIGGRAGRYKTARQAMADSSDSPGSAAPSAEEEKVGYVTTLDPDDLPLVKKTLWKDAKQITSAIIVPPVAFIEQFSTYFSPDTPLSFILMRMRELASVTDRFQLCLKDSFLAITDMIQEFPLSIYDRLVLMTAPVSLRTHGGPEILKAVARCIAERKGGHILDMKEIHLELLDANLDALPPTKRTMYLQQLEALHQAVVLYLWVSYRFPRIFTAQPLAFRVRDLVQEKINEYLSSLNYAEEDSTRRRRQRRLRAQMRDQMQKDLLGPGAAETVQIEEGPGRWEEEGHEEPLVQEAEEMSDVARAGEASANRQASA
ncbi:hypothetical protein jhhlp_004396 [Lomentospora prolificans]|uniref:RNA helicase n=1 Tax=Lomentospora prolificans TaxID=41688 RepID=A0A2N3NBE7_9PEZI|nr:hypothetical protein jhhlp_004396 [Lomentospora prolificans]